MAVPSLFISLPIVFRVDVFFVYDTLLNVIQCPMIQLLQKAKQMTILLLEHSLCRRRIYSRYNKILYIL